MRIIKVDAINSTNLFLRSIYKESKVGENLCLVANEQTEGRGQKGTVWETEKGKNLTFSLLFASMDLGAAKQFKLSALAALAILGVLKKYGINNLKVKWPNDILAGNLKIGGVLIENFLKGNQIHACVVGVGLNVNQENFKNLPRATSLKKLLREKIDLEVLLKELVGSFENNFSELDRFSTREIMDRYHQNLFAIHKVSTFELPTGKRFSGIIQGVNEQGNLLVQQENSEVKSFGLKELKLLY